MTVTTDLFNRLLSLVKQGLIITNSIKDSDYSAAIITELKAEVVAGTITAAQYETYTGTVYSA
jgi:hypothetical protein